MGIIFLIVYESIFSFILKKKISIIYRTATTPVRVNDEAGKALCTFGRSQLVTGCQWAQHRNGDIQIRLSSIGRATYMSHDTLYMTDPLSIRACLDGEHLYRLGAQICERLISIEKPSMSKKSDEMDNQETIELQHCDVCCSGTIKCVGRIVVMDQKIETYNTFLVGLDDTKLRTVKLDLGRCRNYALFSGQVVYLEGENIRGDTIIVDRIVSVTNITSSLAPKLTAPLSMVIASGPFTANDDLVYQPLTDLIKYCEKNPPDILILTGPILSSKNTALTTMAERFDKHFDRMINEITKNLNPNTNILIVSSHEDANSSFVYPTHPYRFKKHYKNLHLLPDPCVVTINDVEIGITSTDVLDHLSKNELAL